MKINPSTRILNLNEFIDPKRRMFGQDFNVLNLLDFSQLFFSFCPYFYFRKGGNDTEKVAILREHENKTFKTFSFLSHILKSNIVIIKSELK
jgi:hypothetical protein